jgi:hypothetical protein
VTASVAWNVAPSFGASETSSIPTGRVLGLSSRKRRSDFGDSRYQSARSAGTTVQRPSSPAGATWSCTNTPASVMVVSGRSRSGKLSPRITLVVAPEGSVVCRPSRICSRREREA